MRWIVAARALERDRGETLPLRQTNPRLVQDGGEVEAIEKMRTGHLVIPIQHPHRLIRMQQSEILPVKGNHLFSKIQILLLRLQLPMFLLTVGSWIIGPPARPVTLMTKGD